MIILETSLNAFMQNEDIGKALSDSFVPNISTGNRKTCSEMVVHYCGLCAVCANSIVTGTVVQAFQLSSAWHRSVEQTESLVSACPRSYDANHDLPNCHSSRMLDKVAMLRL